MDEEKLTTAIQAVLDKAGTAWSIVEHPIYDFPRIFLNPANTEVAQLLQTLEQQQELQRFNEQIFVKPDSAARTTLFALARWLIDRSHDQNIQATLSDLKKYLSLDYNPTIEILAISGLTLDATVELGNGIWLAPINDVPSKNVRNALARKIIGSDPDADRPYSPLAVWMEGRKPPTAALYCHSHVNPQIIAEQDLINHKWISRSDDLHDACACLSLIGPSAPRPLVYWSELETWVPLRGDMGNGYSFVPPEVVYTTTHNFSSDYLHDAKQLYAEYVECPSAIRTRLHVPITRLTQAIGRTSLADKALDLGVAFESLLLSDLGKNEQLSLALRLRGARLLGQDLDNRVRLEKELFELYTCRSIAAHTGKIDDHIKINGVRTPMQDFLQTGVERCASMIRKIIEKGKFPDWKHLILGAPF